jgi:hypothetical protein
LWAPRKTGAGGGGLERGSAKKNRIQANEKLCTKSNSILIAKYLFTGRLKNKSIDNLETQKKYISMKNSQFFNYLLYVKSK